MIKIMLIDDEKPALMLLLETLKRLCPTDEIVAFQRVEEYQAYKDKSDFRIAFIDIELGRVNGIAFALELKKHSPNCNIIFVTSYAGYGTQAFQARPSGYVLKPYDDEDIQRELDNLRYPVAASKNEEEKLRVVTFGNFLVYKKNREAMTFSRTLSKEIFAYLIDRGGFPVTSRDIAEDVLETEFDIQTSKRISKAIHLLIKDLEDAGAKDVIIRQNRQLQVNKNRISCDLYDAVNGVAEAVNSYHGEYMIDYSWAELSDAVNEIGGK